MSKKILIIYTSIGLGHKTMAENIGARLLTGGFEVKYLDVYKAQEGKLIKVGKIIHRFMIETAPWLWRFFYTNKWFTEHSLKYRVKVASKNYLNTKEVIDSFNPDIIITTQAAASGVVAFLKQQGMYKGLFGIAFSDFHLHRYWLYEQADFYLANIKEQKNKMIELGIQSQKIFVCGMSLPKKLETDSLQVKLKFNIKPEEKVVLISSGSLGLGLNEELIQDLSKKPNIKVIVVCGKNKEIFNYLIQKFKKTSVIILAYYKPMAELYAAADIFISKPGGLSVSEALQFNLPILINHALPGQEEINMEYLMKKNLVMPKTGNIEEIVLEELKTGSFRKVLQTNSNLSQLLLGEITALEAVNQMLHGS